MDLTVTVRVSGERYDILASREIVMRELAGAVDVNLISYDVGRLVGPLIQTIAKQLDPKVEADAEPLE